MPVGYYVQMNVQNIVGPGLRLQMNVRTSTNEIDLDANISIEAAWKDWSKQQNCSATKRNSWVNIQELWAATQPRDGEIFVRKLSGFDNKYGFALQPFEGDFIPFDFIGVNPDTGNDINMGIEQDRWGAAVAYWIYSQFGHVGKLEQKVLRLEKENRDYLNIIYDVDFNRLRDIKDEYSQK